MSTANQIHSVTESPETTARNICLDIAGKFRIYRMDAESRERKLRNANAIIERLKDEINSSRDSEKNLRNQLSSAQNRLIHLQESLKELINLSEQQRQHERNSHQIEQRLEKISEAVQQTRKECQNLLKHVTREEDLLKENENIKSELAMKNRENDLMKMEIQMLMTAKKNMETTNHQKLENLEKELEKIKQRETDAEANYGKTLIYYQQQLQEKEQTIKLYEKERMRFLDDFEPITMSEIGSNDFNWADGSVSINSSRRSPKASTVKPDEPETEPKQSNTGVLQLSLSDDRSNPINFGNKKDENLAKTAKKARPPLQFLMASQHPPQMLGPVKIGRKRRLFSTNCNHYTD